MYYRTKGGSIIAKSVSPDGNINLTVYDNAETLDGKTEKYGYKIEVGGAYKGTWTKRTVSSSVYTGLMTADTSLKLITAEQVGKIGLNIPISIIIRE